MVTSRRPNEIKSIRETLNAIRHSQSAKKGHRNIVKSEEPPFKACGNKTEIDRIKKTVEILAESETGLDLLQRAYDNNYMISIQKVGDALGYCDPSKKLVVLNSNCTDDQNVGTLAHELTHAGQFVNGMGSLDNIDTKSYFLETRVMEADAEARAGLALSELREKGYEMAWICFTEDSPTVAKGLEKALKQEGLATPEARNKVLTSTFKAWFDNNAIKNAYDKDNLYFLNDSLEHGEELPLNKSVPPKDLIAQCCQFRDGSNYFKDDPQILLTPKFLGVSQNTMAELNKFMTKRKNQQNLEPDKSVKEIPVVKLKTPSGRHKFSKTTKFAVQHFLSKKLQNN
ncbi:MAG: DUF6782 family putative metallopeptidase [Alphaproteobacteria bacterium]